MVFYNILNSPTCTCTDNRDDSFHSIVQSYVILEILITWNWIIQQNDMKSGMLLTYTTYMYMCHKIKVSKKKKNPLQPAL